MSISIKGIIENSVILKKIIIVYSNCLSSKSFILRSMGKLVSIPLYLILKKKYFKLLMYAKKCSLAQNNTTSKKKISSIKILRPNISHLYFLSKLTFIDAIVGNKKCSTKKYQKALQYIQPSIQLQAELSDHFVAIGRLDLARVTSTALIVDKLFSEFPKEKQIQICRNLGMVCFLLGNNNEASKYWIMSGQLKRTLFTPTTPRNYKILGVAWYAAIGHVAMLDFYLKFMKLYAKKDVHIVATWRIDQTPGEELIKRFADLGINVVEPQNIEHDYNAWAIQHKAPSWGQLTSSEKFALIDDFWEYDFPDGQILGFVHAISRVQKEWEQANHPPLFSLSLPEKLWAQSTLRNLGMPKNTWYVCLHVRETGFHKNWNALYPSMRDSNIQDYTLAITQITNAGGWVIRMGDPSMQPLLPMKNVIDYAHSIYKSAETDILLSANCRFLLGTNSGFANLCTIYNVPCLLTNWVPIGWPLWSQYDLMMPKLFRDKKSGKYLNLEQIFEQNLAFLQNWSELPDQIELVANTPEELAQATVEMMAYCQIENVNYQTSNKAFATSVQAYYEDITQRYGSYTGNRLSQTFVEKHADIFTPSPALTTSIHSQKSESDVMEYA